MIAPAFTAYGSRNGITSFGSLAFMVVFGAMSYLAFRNRDSEDVSGVLPAVVLLAVAVVAVELGYCKRDSLTDGIRTIEKRV